MSHNRGAFYPEQMSEPCWQQPGPAYLGPPQHQGLQLNPQNQNPLYSHQNLGPSSFPPQNQGPQFATQNQGPAYRPQNVGPSYPPQNQYPAQTQGPPQNQFPPQNQGPSYPTQNQGPSFPSQNAQFPPENQGQQFHPPSQGPMGPPHNHGSPYPHQNQAPPLNQTPLLPQNQGPVYNSQNQGPPVIPQTQGPSYPPQNQRHPCPAQTQNPCPPQNQGPFFPPQNQGPLFPPQNQGPQFPPQNQGPQFPPQNQGAPFPVQNQGPVGPPQNQGPQFPPQNQGALVHQQNQVPMCPPQNHVFPPQNQGSMYPQNQGPPGPGPPGPGPPYPQNQGPVGPPQIQGPRPIFNPGPPIPPQNHRPPFAFQNQGPMGPPQNQRPMLPPQNQGPRFPPQNNAPRFPRDNGPPYAPSNQGPAYPVDEEECCDEYGEDWSNENDNYDDDDWSTQNDEYEDDWSSKTTNYYKTKAFKRHTASPERGHRKGAFTQSFIKKDFKEAPFSKRPYIGSKVNHFKSSNRPSSQKQCSNNILVNIVSSNLGSCKPPLGSKLQENKFNSTTIKSKQDSSKQCIKQEGFGTKPIEGKFSCKTNEKSTQNVEAEYSQKTNQSQDKNVGCRFKYTSKSSSATSDLQKDNLQSKTIQKGSLKSLDERHKQDSIGFNSNQEKSKPKSNVMTVQSNDKPMQKLNKSQDIRKENKLSSIKQDSGLSSKGQKDGEQSKVIQNTTERAKDVREHNFVSPKLNDSSTVNLNKSVLQHIKGKLPKPKANNDQTKEELGKTTTNSSLTLNQSKSPLNALGKSQKSSIVERENLRSSKRLNSQNDSTFNDTPTKRMKISGKYLIKVLHSPSKVLAGNSNVKSKPGMPSTSNEAQRKEEQQSNSKVLAVNSNVKSKPETLKSSDQVLSKEEQRSSSKVVPVDSTVKSNLEMKVKIKETSSSNDKVKRNETTKNITSLFQPTENLEENPKIKIEKVTDEVKINVAENLSKLNETTCNPKDNQSIDSSQTNESMVKNCKIESIEVLNIKKEKDDRQMKASDVNDQNSTKDVQHNKEALANVTSDHKTLSSTILVQNNTIPSEESIICPDSLGNVNLEQSKSSYIESAPDGKSQNTDLQINYPSLNDDSQNSSELSENNINPLEANLREFDILDEVEGTEEDEGERSTISSEESFSDGSDQEECDVDVDDIDAMLEEGLPTEQKSSETKTHRKLRRKVILEEIGHDHFDLIPEGWIQIIHNSGMPVYLHQKTRVCTMSRPYFLGPGSARGHKIPLSAIPCLQYRRALEIEKKYEEDHQKKQTTTESEQINENRPPLMPVVSARIETAEENEAAQSLDPFELQEYCKKVFNFKSISIIPFKSWSDRRKYARITKDLRKQQRPLLPSGTKLLKFPIHNPDGTIAKSKGEWVINPNGKSYVCILHEYVQHALRQHPKYQFKELKNPATPYSATVYIGEMQYGSGMGASKKHAKLEAAKAALEVLIPEMKDKIESDSEFGARSGIAKRSQNYENSIFDQIRIEDPRVAEFCAKTTEPPPYAILATCLQRNGMGLDEVKVEYNMNTKRHKEDEFKMSVRNHSAVVLCKNKRDGKQKAAQAILKALHPNIEHFGSLLRMYGNHSIKSVKEKKQEEQEITGLQCKAAVNQPNFAILTKLHDEMRKLALKRKEQLAKGKFHCQNVLPTASTTDLNKINL